MEIFTYDKADWHIKNGNGSRIPKPRGYIHIAYFYGWCVDNKLDENIEDTDEKIKNRFRNRKVTATKLLDFYDGAFVSDMLNDLGNKFAYEYYERSMKQEVEGYVQDLMKIIEIYEIEDTWENYEKVSKKITEAFEKFKKIEKIKS